MLALLALPTAAKAQTAPSADDLIQKAVRRAESHQALPNYLYNKHTVTEELDAQGKVKNRTEKLYEVLVESGFSYLKLTQLNGKDQSPAQLKKQEERELAQRQQATGANAAQRGDERENFLTADLVDKYKFTLAGRTNLNGREVYALTFEPKSTSLPVHNLTDRFLNHIAGKFWIDAKEFEIARLELHLQSEVELWDGLIGTLRQGSYTLERTRLPDGAWFSQSSHGAFEGRKLAMPMLIRTRSESTNFRRQDLASK
jgi:hypothetical protein